MNSGRFKNVAEQRIAMCKSILVPSISTGRVMPKICEDLGSQHNRKPDPGLGSRRSCIEDEVTPEIPPPNPLLAKKLRLVTEPIKFGAKVDFLKLGKMEGKVPEVEISAPKKCEAVTLPVDTSCLPTMKRHLIEAFSEYQVVFERLYPDSIPVKEKKALFFSELYNVRHLLNCSSIESSSGNPMDGRMFIGEDLTPYYHPYSSSDLTLVFESRFESGNLRLALKRSDTEYDLYLQNDINTRGNTQWFYFRVSNTRKNFKIWFNLKNFGKTGSLFNEGMRLVRFSEKHNQETGAGWERAGSDFSYESSGIKRSSGSYYQLKFSYTFEYDGDTVYLAYNYPYTYSNLNEFLNRIEIETFSHEFLSRRLLCRTIAGNRCEYLTITSNNSSNGAKKGVFFTARVHPGETVGSHIMQGVLEFLADPRDSEAAVLRENFVFKIVPMLNPDGVINGNYRCSLAGCDLNRRWKKPLRNLHPTIFHAKRLVKQLYHERGLALVVDLHGHSRAHSSFVYGNKSLELPESTRIYPYILSKLNPNFSYDRSRFGMQRTKEKTARIME